MATFGADITAQGWDMLIQVGAVEPGTYTALPAPVRNLETGQTTAAGTTYDVPLYLRSFRRTEIDGVQVVAGDMLARLPKTLLPVEPTTRDTITHKTIVWSVVSVTEGANGGWWRFQLRRARPV